MLSLVPENYDSMPFIAAIVTSLVLALFTFFSYTPGWSYRAKWDIGNIVAAPLSLSLGLLAAYGMVELTDENYVTATLYTVAVTTISYIFGQTLITDVIARKVDRYTLKLAQGIMFTVAGAYYLYHSDALITMNLWLAGILLVVFLVLWQVTDRFKIGTTPHSWLRLARNIVASGGVLYAAFYISKSFEFEVWFWVAFMFAGVVMIAHARNVGGGDSRAILLGLTAGVPVAGVIPSLLAFLVYSLMTTVVALFAMIRYSKTTVQSLKDVGGVRLPAAPMISGVYLVLVLLATADMAYDWQVFQGIF